MLKASVNVSGGYKKSECVELGIGMQIIQGVNVAPGTIVGAGACVVRDIDEAGVYVGAPARREK